MKGANQLVADVWGLSCSTATSTKADYYYNTPSIYFSFGKKAGVHAVVYYKGKFGYF